MPGRRYDDTPLPDDPGMIDHARPPMNQLGIWLRHEVLTPLGVSHRVNFENTVITVESVKDFLAVAGEYARMIKQSRVPLELGEEELNFDVAHQGQSIRLRLAGDSVDTLLRLAPKSFPRNAAGALFFDTTVPVDLQPVLRALAEAEAGSPEPRPA
jgi:hypothetical protein